MTVPGLGGQQPPPQNSSPAGQLVPGVTPGVTGQVVATRVIIIGTGGELLVYSPSAGTGNLIASIAGMAGTDPFGNTFVEGIAAYATGGGGLFAIQLGAQTILGTQFPAMFFDNLTTPFTIPPTVVGAGNGAAQGSEIQLYSGQSSSSAQTSAVLCQDSVSSGVTNGAVVISAGATTLNNTATTVTPSPNVNPGHQSPAPATYSQSYENASTNRINQIMDVLVQTGVWHT